MSVKDSDEIQSFSKTIQSIARYWCETNRNHKSIITMTFLVTLIRQASIQKVLGNDSRILNRRFQTNQKSCGKSIYHSHYSLMMWHHWNFVTVARVNYFDDKNRFKPNENAFHLMMNLNYLKTRQHVLKRNSIFVGHARGR